MWVGGLGGLRQEWIRREWQRCRLAQSWHGVDKAIDARALHVQVERLALHRDWHTVCFQWRCDTATQGLLLLLLLARLAVHRLGSEW